MKRRDGVLPCATLAAVFLSGVFACSGKPSVDEPDSGADRDGSTPEIDASVPDAPPVNRCFEWMFMPVHFARCELIEPDGVAIDLTEPGLYTYDSDVNQVTGPGTMLQPPDHILDANPQVRIISVESFHLGDRVSLRVVGCMPLVVASWGDIAIDAGAELDASSRRADGAGAGANPVLCDPMQGGEGTGGAGQASDAGGGGGGGGGFRNIGGLGATGSNLETTPASGGAEGTTVNTPTRARGGCAGGDGGDGNNNAGRGLGGDGGGAIHLTARRAITVTGIVHAGGAGGGGPTGIDGGGGGGGSGGYVGLEAETVTINAPGVVAANGGGGAGGSNAIPALAQDGADGLPGVEAAVGGMGEGAVPLPDGGNGGAGAIGAPGVESAENSGGGGGGGGSGYIIMWGTRAGDAAAISPQATELPLQR